MTTNAAVEIKDEEIEGVLGSIAERFLLAAKDALPNDALYAGTLIKDAQDLKAAGSSFASWLRTLPVPWPTPAAAAVAPAHPPAASPHVAPVVGVPPHHP